MNPIRHYLAAQRMSRMLREERHDRAQRLVIRMELALYAAFVLGLIVSWLSA